MALLVYGAYGGVGIWYQHHMAVLVYFAYQQLGQVSGGDYRVRFVSASLIPLFDLGEWRHRRRVDLHTNQRLGDHLMSKPSSLRVR